MKKFAIVVLLLVMLGRFFEFHHNVIFLSFTMSRKNSAHNNFHRNISFIPPSLSTDNISQQNISMLPPSVFPASFARYVSLEILERFNVASIHKCCSFTEMSEFFTQQRMKRKGSGPPVVIFRCHGSICGGLGDRIRGLIHVFLEAKTQGFYFDYDSNLFSDLLKKTDAIDGAVHIPKEARALTVTEFNPDGSLKNCDWSKYDLVYVSTNKHADGLVGCLPEQLDFGSRFFGSCNRSSVYYNTRISVLGCGWWLLFRINDRLKHSVLDELKKFAKWQQINMRVGNPVIAVHVRVGDKLGGFSAPVNPTDIPLLEVLGDKVLACANQMGQSLGLQNATILIVSDSSIVKMRVQKAEPKTVWSTGLLPEHVEKSASHDRYVSSLVDVFMLALCDALLKSPSGFSHLAEGIGFYPTNRVRLLSSCGIETRSGGE
jgi:hypothetical protein